LHTEALCKVHVLLDDDQAGRQAFEAARKEGMLETEAINFTTVGGKREAELEDLYVGDVYKDIVKSETGFEMIPRGPDREKKWTDRLRNLLHRAGKPTDDNTVLAIKLKVAQAAAASGVGAISEPKRGPSESLVNSLKGKLNSGA
jgi:hypothetical protein